MTDTTVNSSSALPIMISFADRLNSFARTKLNKELNRYGLKFNQWRLIHAIASKSIYTPAKLADELMIERATVSRYLDQLEECGCIERTHNNLDRRVVDIKLTSPEFLDTFVDKFHQCVIIDFFVSKLIANLLRLNNSEFPNHLDQSFHLNYGLNTR